MIHIFLSGGMVNTSYEEAEKWRQDLIDDFRYLVSQQVCFFNPNNHYNYNKKNPWTAKHKNEQRDYNLSHLKKSDLVIVNFNDPNSIGVAQELAIAKENGIPVIGLCKNVKAHLELHDWLRCCVDRMFYDVAELEQYVLDFYIEAWR